METLIINIPEKNSTVVKQILTALGVTMEKPVKTDVSEFKKSLANMSVWTDEDIKVVEEAGKAFDSLKPQQW